MLRSYYGGITVAARGLANAVTDTHLDRGMGPAGGFLRGGVWGGVLCVGGFVH